MIKVTLIRQDDALAFTTAISDFCEIHKVIDIKLQTTLMVENYNNNGTPAVQRFVDTALILYEE